MKTNVLFVLALSLFTVLTGCAAETDPTPEKTPDETSETAAAEASKAPELGVEVDEVGTRFACCYEAPCGLFPPCRRPFESP